MQQQLFTAPLSHSHPLPNPIQLLDSTIISQSSANPPPPKTRHCACVSAPSTCESATNNRHKARL
ncbi:hypothetical protein V8C43DRAFT_283467 [Trichoderma afarasin]